MKLRGLTVLAGIVLALVSFQAAMAQATNAGDISGTVTDNTGAVIPGATVTVINNATGVSHDYTTNAAGIYDTNSIVAGDYKITFSKDGFTSLVHSSITVNVGQLQLNAQLAVGTVNTQVVVNSDVPLLNTESGALSATMSYETINQLPQVSSIGQNWSSFNILQPGQAGAPGGAQGSTGTGTSNGTMLSVNGNLPFSTVLADGAETTLPASANSDITVQEDIQEVQTSSSAFSAQYGVGEFFTTRSARGRRPLPRFRV